MQGKLAGLGLLMLLGCGAARGAETLSYEAARARLMERSDALQAAAAEIRAREAEVDAAASLGMPEFGLNYQLKQGSKEMDFGTLPYIGQLKRKVDLDGPRAAATMSWSIYSGGRISALQAVRDAEAGAARAEARDTGARVESELVRRYFGLAFARDVERLRDAQLQQAGRDLERAQAFERQGQISPLERLSAQVARDEAEREALRARQERQTLEAALARLLRGGGPFELATPLFVPATPLPPLNEWLGQSTENPQLAGLAARREAAQQGIEAAKAGFKPEVFAYGEYNFIRRNLSLVEPSWIAGIGVSYKLFAREDRSAKVGSARAQLERVEALQAESRNRVETAIEAAWLRAEQARSQYALFSSTLELARENLRLRQRAFDEGQGTVLEISDARNTLLRAETGRAQVAYEFDVALMGLLEAAGQSARFADYVKKAEGSSQP